MLLNIPVHWYVASTRATHSIFFEYDKHFIVYPQMVWKDSQKEPIPGGKKVPEGFSYSSGNNTEWLSVEEIKELLKTIDLEK